MYPVLLMPPIGDVVENPRPNIAAHWQGERAVCQCVPQPRDTQMTQLH
jgi:hypothetical protein